MTSPHSLRARLAALRIPDALAAWDAVGLSLAIEPQGMALVEALVRAVEEREAGIAVLRAMLMRERA